MIYYIDDEERKLAEEEMIINAFYSLTADCKSNLFCDDSFNIDNLFEEKE